MTSDPNRILYESIRRLLRRGAMSNLRKIINKTHAADLSVVFRSLPMSDQRRLFNMIEDVEDKAILFSELEEDSLLGIVEAMEIPAIVTILDEMANDDVADFIGRLPEELADTLLERMKTEDSEEVEGLLRYDDDTAGGIMNPDFIALEMEITARKAIESLQQEYSEVEMPFYLYIVDDQGRLCGVSSLRQLVVVPPDTPLKNFIAADVVSVRTDVDQE